MGFQFKKELAEKILKGLKTQTRRPDKHDDYGDANVTTIYRNGRKLWKIGQTYAIQPGRGKKGIGFLKIKNIRNEDVRFISQTDAVAEGFEDRIGFLKVWCGFYDPAVTIEDFGKRGFDVAIDTGGGVVHRWYHLDEDGVIKALLLRPNDLYRAHIIDFELVKTVEAVQS